LRSIETVDVAWRLLKKRLFPMRIDNVETVVLENPVALEIIEFGCAAGVGFCRHVSGVDFVSMVPPRVLPQSV